MIQPLSAGRSVAELLLATARLHATRTGQSNLPGVDGRVAWDPLPKAKLPFSAEGGGALPWRFYIWPSHLGQDSPAPDATKSGLDEVMPGGDGP